MILTVTPNASIDKTYTIADFRVDRIYRPTACSTVPGGKGINVARVLEKLRREALATGFVGGRVGEAIVSGLDAEGIHHDFIRVRGESRLCIKIMDPKSTAQTEINEPGPVVDAEDVDLLLNKVREFTPGKEFLVLCGNCPPGVPPGFYADAIKAARDAGVKAVLDATGEHLLEGIKAQPFLIKPNLTELSQLADTELCTLEEITRAAKSLKQFGIVITAVTMGRSGAIVTDGVQVWHAVPPAIEFASAVGSGDSFLAAFLDSLLCGESLADALVWGTAAGAANATTYGAGFCTRESIIEMRQGVTLTKID